MEWLRELDREVPILDPVPRPDCWLRLPSDSIFRALDSCSSGSIMRACWIRVFPGQRGQAMSRVRKCAFSSSIY